MGRPVSSAEDFIPVKISLIRWMKLLDISPTPSTGYHNSVRLVFERRRNQEQFFSPKESPLGRTVADSSEGTTELAVRCTPYLQKRQLAVSPSPTSRRYLGSSDCGIKGLFQALGQRSGIYQHHPTSEETEGTQHLDYS